MGGGQGGGQGGGCGGGHGGGHGGGLGGGAEEEKRVDVTEEGKQLVRICSSEIKVERAKTSFCDIVFNC